MSLEDQLDKEMDLLWDSMPFGRRGHDLRSNSMSRSPLSMAAQPKSRRSLTAFPRYGLTGRDRGMGDYRSMGFPGFRSDGDDIAHRIQIHHGNDRPMFGANDDNFFVTPLSSDFEDMFRDHRPVLSSSSSTARDIPISHDVTANGPSGRSINIMRDDDFDFDDPFRSRRMSDTFADPRTRPFSNRLGGRNVHFADDVSRPDGGERNVNIVRDDAKPVNAENDKEDTSESKTDEPAEPKEANLAIKKIDCHVLENAKAHHTDLFQHVEKGLLIVRRGQKFEITITFNREFDIRKDQIAIMFFTGDQEQPGKGSQICIKFPDQIFSAVWHAEIVSHTDKQMKMTIRPDVQCIVGSWKMTLLPVVKKKDADDMYGRTVPEIPMFILFNPWSRDDHTYFPDANKLSEYVLNDSGCIFVGTDKQIGVIPWFYGQFELGVLEAAVYCLKKAFRFQSSKAMGDPVRVARAISRIVNSADENGVVLGNWSGRYTDGTAPQMWVGSVGILKRFLQTRRPVKYGQCYVFAGLVTTICRALGLPCRTVTNFSSAHDTDGSLTLDVHWDLINNKEITSLNTDTLWNFHVWNDVWMSRKDLSFGNDGWQAVDATPQETSGGKIACGPASVNAIMNGRCEVCYDSPFIYAEVNADRVHWGRHKDGTWTIIGIDKAATGKKICTKVPDGKLVPAALSHCDGLLEDITNQYKHPEAAARDRLSTMLANSLTLSPRARKEFLNQSETVDVEIKCPDHVQIGSDVTISTSFKNKSGQQLSLEGKLFVDVISYTGKTVTACKEDDLNVKLATYDKHLQTVHVKAEQYLRHLGEAAMLKVSLLTKIKETGQFIARQEYFRFRTPELKIKCFNNTCQVGRPLSIQLSFRNPLQDRPLTGCYVYVEGSGVEEPRLVSMRNVPQGREMACDVDIVVTQPGRRQIFATFFCNEINDVKGLQDLYIQPVKEGN